MIKKELIKTETPYYHIIFTYMIGRNWTTFDFTCNESEIEEVIKYVSILNKLNPLENYTNIYFAEYPEYYPGEYIGISEEEYKIFLDLLYYKGYDDKIKCEIHECMISEFEDSSTLFFGVTINYYENEFKYNVKF